MIETGKEMCNLYCAMCGRGLIKWIVKQWHKIWLMSKILQSFSLEITLAYMKPLIILSISLLF